MQGQTLPSTWSVLQKCSQHSDSVEEHELWKWSLTGANSNAYSRMFPCLERKEDVAHSDSLRGMSVWGWMRGLAVLGLFAHVLLSPSSSRHVCLPFLSLDKIAYLHLPCIVLCQVDVYS